MSTKNVKESPKSGLAGLQLFALFADNRLLSTYTQSQSNFIICMLYDWRFVQFY